LCNKVSGTCWAYAVPLARISAAVMIADWPARDMKLLLDCMVSSSVLLVKSDVIRCSMWIDLIQTSVP